MSRARNIKPGFFENETLAECDPLARILFAGLWCEADRTGRLEDRIKRIKTKCLPYDDCDVDALLQQLADRAFITRYAVDGVRYIQIDQFKKHQNPHLREAPSTIPAPGEHSASTVQVQDKHSAGTVQGTTKALSDAGADDGTGQARCSQGADSEQEPEIPEQAPCEHCASTVLGTEKAGTSPADSLNLIPDSPILIPERAARAGAGDGGNDVVVTDIHGNPTTSIIAELTPAQSATVVTVCKALRKMGGSPRFHPGDELLAALAIDGFTAEQVVRCGGEKALRDAGLWNDPDVHPDLFDLLVNGAPQQEMGLTQAQYTALRGAVAQVSIGYIASALRGRRRDANQAQQGSTSSRGAGRRPSATDNFEGKTYAGTAIDKLPIEFRDAIASAGINAGG